MLGRLLGYNFIMNKKIFSFAIGNIWRWQKSNNRNGLIDIIRKANLDIDGLELTLAQKEDVFLTKLSTANKKWLMSLDYVTIHAPFKLMRAADNEEEIIKQLDIIAKLYPKIKARNVIIHPRDLPEPETLKRYDFNISTENVRFKKRGGITISNLKKIFCKYPKIKLCLDVAHAYTWSKYETRKLVKNFKNRISQIHFSGTYRKKDHKSLRIVTRNFMESIEPIKGLDAPIVIEEDFKRRNLKFVREEIEFVKKIFNQ